MLRKFYVNMTQKGRFLDRYSSFIKLNYISFEKTDKKQVEIVAIDFEKIDDYYKEEVENYKKSGGMGFLYHYKNDIENILGINNNNPHKIFMSMREIKDNDKEGYRSIDIKYIDKETEKAYNIKGFDWIPKSQTIKEGNLLYIKNWLVFKI